MSTSIRGFHPSLCWEHRAIYWLRCALSGVFNELLLSKSCQGSRTSSSGSGTASIRFFFLGKCQEEKKKKGKEEKANRDSWVCRAAGCLIERGFLWARVDISVNEAFPRKPGNGYSCGEGLRHQWGCEGKAPALSIAILSSVAIKGFLTCHGGSVAYFKDNRVIFIYLFHFLIIFVC